jgi:hypothetical protein
VSDLHSILRDEILRQIKFQVGSAGGGEGSLGPPCAAFYLLHFAVDDEQAAGERRERSHLVSLWRVTLSGVEELPIEAGASVTTGAIRGSLYENAIVSLSIDVENELAHIALVFGPLHGHGGTYNIRRHGDSVSLGDSGKGSWIS